MRKPLTLTILLAAVAAFAAGCAQAQLAPPAATRAPAPTRTATGVAAARCTVVSQAVTPDATESSLFPPPGPSDWILGPTSASVVFIEYGDFM